MDDRELVVRMIAYMEHNLVQPLEAENLAVYSGYSLNRLRQKFFKECRRQGARFFEEIRDLKLIPSEPARQVCSSLTGVYDGIADYMDRIKEKKLDDRERISLLKKYLSLEKKAETGIQEIVSLL